MIICSPQLGVSPDSNLGGEVYDREMLKSLDDLGVVTLIILPLGKKHPPLKHAKFYFLPTPIVYPPWLFNIMVLPYLFFLKWKYGFEILRVHSPYFVGPAALFFKVFNPKTRVVASYLHLEPNNKFFDFIDSNLIQHYSLITTISEATKNDIIRKYKVDSEKITVIPCGVDAKYRPLPKNPELVKKYNLADKKILLYLGQLIKRKNISFLFKVLDKLPEDYVLMICGNGPMRSELEKIASGSVIFTGRIAEEEKVDYYNLADIFVYPSRLEGFGLSVLEASACGRSIIANRLSVFEELNLKNCKLMKLDSVLWAKEIRKGRYIQEQDMSGYGWKIAVKKYLEMLGSR